MSRKRGEVITFYSYKGGTGRSMALVNMAWVMASNGRKVLLIDWDLEAPGLHHYFRPFLVDKELRSTPGLIDCFWDMAKQAVTPVPKGGGPEAFKPLDEYVVGLDWTFPASGSIELIPAGRQDDTYSQRVNTFDWDNFYERLGGGKLLHAATEALREEYDYILIDSRTGVSDTSGICTVQMPDMLVVCFTLNRQSMRGAAGVASSVQAQRGREFEIFPVPTRLENAETDKRDKNMAFAKKLFAPFLLHLQSDRSVVNLAEQARYWSEVQTPYKTFYAFEEVPAAFKDELGAYDTILASTERLAKRLTGVFDALAPVYDEKTRSRLVETYALSLDEALEVEPPTLSTSGALPAAWMRLASLRMSFITAVALIALAFAIPVVILQRSISGFRDLYRTSSQEAADLQKRLSEVELDKLNAQRLLKDAEAQLAALQSPGAKDRTQTLTITRDKRSSYAPGSVRMGDNGHLLQVTLEAPGPIREVAFRCQGHACGWVYQCPDRCPYPRVELNGNRAVWRAWSNSADDAVFTFSVTFVTPPQTTLRCQSTSRVAQSSEAGIALQSLADRVEKAIPRLKLEIYPDGAVVQDRDVPDAVRKGILDCAVVPLDIAMKGRGPGLEILEEPVGVKGYALIINPRAFEIVKPALPSRSK